MKRLLSLLLTLLLLAMPLIGLAQHESNPSGVIVGGAASVFENNPPLFGESAKGTIPSGATVVIAGWSGDYCSVLYFGGPGVLSGWVDRAAVRMLPDPTPVPAPTAVPPRPTAVPPRPTAVPPHPTAAPMPQTDIGIVISETVTLRQSQSTTAAKIASIKHGDELSVLSEQNGWYYVTHWDGKVMQTGWVLSDYVVVNPLHITTTKATYAYSMPVLGSKKVGQLVSGSTLLVIGEYGDFWVISLRAASAFVYKHDLR